MTISDAKFHREFELFCRSALPALLPHIPASGALTAQGYALRAMQAGALCAQLGAEAFPDRSGDCWAWGAEIAKSMTLSSGALSEGDTHQVGGRMDLTTEFKKTLAAAYSEISPAGANRKGWIHGLTAFESRRRPLHYRSGLSEPRQPSDGDHPQIAMIDRIWAEERWAEGTGSGSRKAFALGHAAVVEALLGDHWTEFEEARSREAKCGREEGSEPREPGEFLSSRAVRRASDRARAMRSSSGRKAGKLAAQAGAELAAAIRMNPRGDWETPAQAAVDSLLQELERRSSEDAMEIQERSARRAAAAAKGGFAQLVAEIAAVFKATPTFREQAMEAALTLLASSDANPRAAQIAAPLFLACCEANPAREVAFGALAGLCTFWAKLPPEAGPLPAMARAAVEDNPHVRLCHRFDASRVQLSEQSLDVQGAAGHAADIAAKGVLEAELSEADIRALGVCARRLRLAVEAGEEGAQAASSEAYGATLALGRALATAKDKVDFDAVRQMLSSEAPKSWPALGLEGSTAGPAMDDQVLTALEAAVVSAAAANNWRGDWARIAGGVARDVKRFSRAGFEAAELELSLTGEALAHSPRRARSL